MTRIVAGAVGGRRIEVPPRGTRPTSEKVREAVFSALEAATDLHDARVLDLFGGSGALGLEALSRGAGHAMFVESDRRAAQILRRNATSLGFRSIRVEQAKVETVLATEPDEPFDVVLVDPPYDLDVATLDRILSALAANGWTEPGTVLVVERSLHGDDPEWPRPLSGLRVKRYGDTAVHWGEHVER
ncbi:16S rRNA (guanine(966)-N(2))-methyltransferase RsmD [Allosaccharopolyspora coralli]|uniref:16S rRNA (Guanine(966)-N(2))-methyltransferase RsmD n=1 Tax=Allosaccharopolyspora coralli TaxID=2665642 RepID=A0A5Q3Q9M8_9PSEU|nr:16S rRNA (guanine(966)-N(2))-methyltransferase RsmD [Allosaccharopolyspora coralli]QGK71073.1 16S rRNA (guanine(966)-N(2))-methyltransferase RsmD [Allosaccharopolyspora coralli]